MQTIRKKKGIEINTFNISSTNNIDTGVQKHRYCSVKA